MKKIVSSFLLCFALVEVHGQVNLVPNPSFEERTGCPEGYPDLDGKLNDWMSFRGTPDYFNNCSSMNGYYNWWGFQKPHFGESYAGIITFAKTGANPPLTREYIGIQLSMPLIVDEKYYVSFYVSAAWDDINMNIASNKLGALFTTYLITDPLSIEPLNNFAHIWSESIISDTVVWTKISGELIADSAYKYLVIGNFFEDSNTDTINLPIQEGFPTNQAGLYYLDDVCVSTDSNYCENWTNLSVENLTSYFDIFPNPSSDFIKVSAKNKIQNFEICNNFGQIIFKQNDIDKQTYIIDVSNFDKGIYILNINSIYFHKIVIN